MLDDFTYVSAAGGAFLEWLEGKPLPGGRCTCAVNRPTILFHSLDHARAAVAAAEAVGAPLTLQTAPGAASYAGVGFLKAVVDAAAGGADVEAVIDCGAESGAALAALRAGWTRVLYSGRREVRDKLADIAAQQGARVLEPDADTAALDLLDVADAPTACRDFLVAGKR